MLTRRNFLAIATATATALLAGCSGEKDEAPAADPATEPVEDAPAADAEPAGNVLVAYFSATGNTEGVATAIAERLGADAFAIEAAQPYTEADLNYSDDASRTSVERADGTNPELAQVTPDGWKTVVPFCTSGSSGIGSSAELLAEMAGAGEWREGERFSAGAGDEAADWVVGLGL